MQASLATFLLDRTVETAMVVRARSTGVDPAQPTIAVSHSKLRLQHFIHNSHFLSFPHILAIVGPSNRTSRPLQSSRGPSSKPARHRTHSQGCTVASQRSLWTCCLPSLVPLSVRLSMRSSSMSLQRMTPSWPHTGSLWSKTVCLISLPCCDEIPSISLLRGRTPVELGADTE